MDLVETTLSPTLARVEGVFIFKPQTPPSSLGSKETWYIWQNNRTMYNELKPIVESQLRNHGRTEGPKTINSLAIRAYMK
ncbi:hypothetical protein BN1708_004762 [Verticillium longisporum]|uniref:Uncharacterized protein n=1 Tax=Verticillium longisporum TaxID=100787 RepID=A0A0G4M4F4_VERLO|nr:hypothetical protein BN1708_004762 [Verticillium longisporum]